MHNDGLTGVEETQSGTIDLPEDEPGTIKLLIQYLYEGEYEPFLPPAAVQTVIVAPATPIKRGKQSVKRQEYTLSFPHTCYDRNKDCCSPRICPHHYCGNDCFYTCSGFTCETCTTPALTGPSSQLLVHTKMYEIADKYDVAGLKQLAREKFSRGCKHFWNTPEFHIAATHAFSTTPEDDDGLRGLVSQTIAGHMELAQTPEIRTLLVQFNGLALGILDAKSEELGWYKKTDVQC